MQMISRHFGLFIVFVLIFSAVLAIGMNGYEKYHRDVDGSYYTGVYCLLNDKSNCEVIKVSRTRPEDLACPEQVGIGNALYYLKEDTCEVIRPEG